MNRKCTLCGRRNVDLICNKCGSFICKKCYLPIQNSCKSCWRSYDKATRWNNPKIPILAFSLLMIILIGAYWTMNVDKASKFTLFPFVFKDWGWNLLIIINLLFFAIFTFGMILPWFLAFNRSRLFWDEGIYRLNDGTLMGRGVMETLEYFITLQVPRKLKDSIFYEEEYGDLVISSKEDSSFRKSYSLPDYYLIDEIESQYDGDYLLLKLYLNKLSE